MKWLPDFVVSYLASSDWMKSVTEALSEVSTPVQQEKTIHTHKRLIRKSVLQLSLSLFDIEDTGHLW